MAENKKSEVIDLRDIFKRIRERKKLFYIVLPAVFVVSSLLIVSVPRTYTCQIMLAPELSLPSTGSSLSSIAASFGFDVGSMATTDAISPMLYPDLLESPDFQVGLFTVRVRNLAGDIDTDYYTYLRKYQQQPWWNFPMRWMRQLMDNILPKSEEKTAGATDGQANVRRSFMLSKEEGNVAKAIASKIKCVIDKKTNVITITVTDQDRLICATMADSVRVRLQSAITDYRTNKARTDMEYYAQLTKTAKQEYDEARRLYSSFADANRSAILQSVQTKISDLENDMQVKFNTYNAMNTQYQAAKAKVQERTPAFTILHGATVPEKATGPKRMIFVAGMLFLSVFVVLAYIYKDIFAEALRQQKPESA